MQFLKFDKYYKARINFRFNLSILDIINEVFFKTNITIK